MERITIPPVEEPEADSPEIAEFKERVLLELTSSHLSWEDQSAAINSVLVKLGIRKEPEKPVRVKLSVAVHHERCEVFVKALPSELRDATADQQADVLAQKVQLRIGEHAFPADPEMILSAEVVKEIPEGWRYTSDQGQVLHYFPLIYPDYRQYTHRSHYAKCGTVSHTTRSKSKRGTDEFCKRCLDKQPID